MSRRRKASDAQPPTEDPAAASDGQQAVATIPEPSANGHHETNGTPPEPVTNRPCKSFSCAISAGVYAEASVWPKQIQVDGREIVVYSCTVRKNYKTDDGWKNTQFFRGSELFIVRHLLELAERFILDQRVEADPPF